MSAIRYDRIISDNGSGYVKLGYGNETFPRYVIPSILGRPMLRASQKIGDQELKEVMIGDEASPLRAYLEITYPLKEGQIKNWDDMELLWDYCFAKKLGLPENKQDKKILLTEAALNPSKNREKMGQIMFEKYDFGGVMFEYQAILTLIARGQTTGAVLDSGDGVSHVIPVYQGMIQTDNIKRLNIAGRHVTEYLIKLLMLRGYAFNSSADFEVVRQIKEDLCYISRFIKKERTIAKDTTVIDKEYKLPDGQTIIVGRERFEAPEILMNPSLIDDESEDCATMIYNAICGCPLDIQKELAANIYLSGGTSMIPGISSRLEYEIQELYVKKKFKGDRAGLKRVPIKIHDPPSRKNAVFLGASFMANISEDHQYISKQEYQESGAKVFHNRVC